MKNSTAAMVAGVPVIAAEVLGGRFAPTPSHPATAAWYARLQKSPLTPPGPVFGAAWAVLDGLLWFAGARILTRPPTMARNVALGLWGLNVLGVGGFSWVLFGKKDLGAALGVTAGMVATSAGFVGVARIVDRKAAVATLPLAIWVGFAFLLQEELWRRNR